MAPRESGTVGVLIQRIRISAGLGYFNEVMIGAEIHQNLFIYPTGKFIYKSYKENGRKSKKIETKYYYADPDQVRQLMDNLGIALRDFKKRYPVIQVMDGGITEVEITGENENLRFGFTTPTGYEPLIQCQEEIKRLTGNRDLWLFS